MYKVSHNKLFALCRKEFYQIIRDPSSITIAFILPTILLFLFGFGINLDSQSVALGLLVEDTSPIALDFSQTLSNNPSFIVSESNSRSELFNQLAIGKIRGLVIIPHEFSSRLLNDSQEAIFQIINEGSDPNTAVFVESTLQGVWNTWLQQSGFAAPLGGPIIQVEDRYWYNPSAKSSNFLIPGSIAIIMTIIGSLLTSLVIAREWERGTIESILASPATPMEFILSKFIPYYLLGIASLLTCFFVSITIMDVVFRGSILLLLLMTTLFLIPSLAIGLLISSLTKNQFDAAQLALNFAFLPAIMLSGFIFEIESMPAVVTFFSYLFPATYYVSSLQTIFQAGFISSVIIKNTAILLLFSFLLVFLLVKKTNQTIE